MGFAEYFDRTCQAACQILQGVNPEAFRSVLNGHFIGVALDGHAGQLAENRAAADLAVRLLARLYPEMAIVPLEDAAESQADELGKLALGINPKIGITHELEKVTACLVIGNTPVTMHSANARRPIYIGSDGWIAKLSSEEPVGGGDSDNPLGAGAAACFGAANLFKQIFSQKIPGSQPDEKITFSLLDLNPQTSCPSNPPLKAIDIGESFLVGLGAIGNGAIWALARLPLTGILNILDHEELDLGNLQRYVMTLWEDKGKPKVELASRWLSGTQLEVRYQRATWNEYVRAREHWSFERIAVALDTAKDRIGVQASLPRWVVNGWTREGIAGVSTHTFLGEEACMACLYLPKGQAKNEDELVAAVLGFPQNSQEDLVEVRRRLHLNVPTDRGYLERIASMKNIVVEQLLAFEGKPLGAIYREGICGGKILQFSENLSSIAEVPMPFVSALAGILLSAKLITDAGHFQGCSHSMTQIDLLKPLSPILATPRRKHPEKRCLCQDEDYIAVYEQKYSGAQ